MPSFRKMRSKPSYYKMTLFSRNNISPSAIYVSAVKLSNLTDFRKPSKVV